MMYAIVENNQVVLAPVSLMSRYKDIGAFHLLTDEERKAYGWYPLDLDENYNPRTQSRSEVPEFIFDGYRVIGKYTITDKSTEVIRLETLSNAEKIIKNHINNTVVSLGYNTEDSIAKYLVEGNKYYTECKAISIWIGLVWTEFYNIINDLIGNNIYFTDKELIDLMPTLAAK